MAFIAWRKRKRRTKELVDQWEEQEKLYPSDPSWSYAQEEGDNDPTRAFREDIERKIGSAAARYHRCDGVRQFRGCDKSGRCSCTRSEEALRKIPNQGPVLHRLDRLNHARAEERDIEYIGPVERLFLGQEIEQERSQSSAI